MYKFLRAVTVMSGKQYAIGSIVPDGVFGCLPEMVRVGDIEEIKEDREVETISIEIAEPDPDEARKEEAARKARERRAAKKEESK